jgi:hypothetical protein
MPYHVLRNKLLVSKNSEDGWKVCLIVLLQRSSTFYTLHVASPFKNCDSSAVKTKLILLINYVLQLSTLIYT